MKDLIGAVFLVLAVAVAILAVHVAGVERRIRALEEHDERQDRAIMLQAKRLTEQADRGTKPPPLHVTAKDDEPAFIANFDSTMIDTEVLPRSYVIRVEGIGWIACSGPEHDHWIAHEEASIQMTLFYRYWTPNERRATDNVPMVYTINAPPPDQVRVEGLGWIESYWSLSREVRLPTATVLITGYGGGDIRRAGERDIRVEGMGWIEGNRWGIVHRPGALTSGPFWQDPTKPLPPTTQPEWTQPKRRRDEAPGQDARGPGVGGGKR